VPLYLIFLLDFETFRQCGGVAVWRFMFFISSLYINDSVYLCSFLCGTVGNCWLINHKIIVILTNILHFAFVA
jgi:hypothetical protein